MISKTEENKSVLDLAYDLEGQAKKQNWVSRYDSETDSFSFSVPKLPNDARIKYFGDEVAFYMTKDKKIKGIFIEYFKSNFVKHHKELNEIKELLKGTKKERKEEIALFELKKKKVEKIMPKLEEAIKKALIENIGFNS